MPPRHGGARRPRGSTAGPFRFRFDDCDALNDAFARAQQECWIEGCTADVESRTLELWLAPGVSHPSASAALRGRVERITGRRG